MGMCGGLVTASCERTHDVVRYQLGRLLGYLLLGLLAGTLGRWLNLGSYPGVSLVSGIIIGSLFVYWGVQNFRGKIAELPTPKFLGKLYGKCWFRLIHKNSRPSKAFIMGFISLLLPCGLLYGVVIGTIALEGRWPALGSMFFFWLGTLPSMVAAPGIIQKILRPFKASLPKTYAVTLVVIGLMTISFRLSKFHPENPMSLLSQPTHKSCH